ncbi:Oligopeptide transport system permease protein OppC [bacterium HR10]|nr:Oligopeptide transport system permease protein OppC [bacterium HR10]
MNALMNREPSTRHERRQDMEWEEPSPIRTRTPLQRPSVLLATGILALISAAVVIGPMWLSYGYDQADLDLGLSPPSLSNGHYLGTDILGRDLLARLLYGGRISLLVALVATVISTVIGTLYGALSGYFGGRVDDVMMRVVDLLFSLPYLFLVLVLMALFAEPEVVDPMIRLLRWHPEGAWAEWLRGPGVRMVLLFVALGAVSWLTLARIVRGQVLALKNELFVEAARAAGAGTWHILFRHLIPNAGGPILAYTVLTIPSVMLQEAFISFLGLGIQAPQASWGTLVHDGVEAMSVAPWLFIFPAGTMVLVLFCFHVVGEALREAWERRA